MITKDQPTIFGDKLVCGLSSADDGNMKKTGLSSAQQTEADANRQKFFGQIGIVPSQAVLVNLSYEKTDFTVYSTVNETNKGQGITGLGVRVTDGLATNSKNLALFLPIADCVGAILFDPLKQALMVSHLGRHSTEQRGASKSVQYMEKQFGSQPKNILAWLSPAPGSDSYPLFAFKNKSLKQVNQEHLLEAGLTPDHIQICQPDTSNDKNYFSHSEFLKGNRQTDGRYAIVAMLR